MSHEHVQQNSQTNRVAEKQIVGGKSLPAVPVLQKQSVMVVQRMRSVNNVALVTLADLNTELQKPAYSNKLNTRPINFPIVATDFNRGQTSAEVNTAVSNSALNLYDYIDLSDVWDAIDTELVTLTAPPVNHQLVHHLNASAYVDYNGFNLSAAQDNYLVDAVNNIGNSRHQTANATNMPANATGYIHDYSTNTLFAFDDSMGTHRGISKVKVLQQGRVNSGNHQF